jgi:hypothetical protein
MDLELPNNTSEWIDKVFLMQPAEMEGLALQAYRYQYHHNKIYGAFCRAVGKEPGQVHGLQQIPFLPIGFFKSHEVLTGREAPALVFESSGTGGQVNSLHLVRDPEIYIRSFLGGFRKFYGDPSQWCFLGLLPSYLERKNSSLVYMVERLIRESNHPAGGFYLYDQQRLKETLLMLEASGQATMLFGVTFALLDFADRFSLDLKKLVIMETGGMKGRREEWTRRQVHDYLTARLGPPVIHSEYGMTELFSQAYSQGDGLFRCPPWMQVLVRDEDDPLRLQLQGGGVINVVDLANIHSCCFIATEDMGILRPGGDFEVLGRLDNADLRGCSLMVA